MSSSITWNCWFSIHFFNAYSPAFSILSMQHQNKQRAIYCSDYGNLAHALSAYSIFIQRQKFWIASCPFPISWSYYCPQISFIGISLRLLLNLWTFFWGVKINLMQAPSCTWVPFVNWHCLIRSNYLIWTL